MNPMNAVVGGGAVSFPRANLHRPVASSAAPVTETAVSTSSPDPGSTISPQGKDQQTESSRQTLDPRTTAIISQLAQRDQQVRAHEAAHVAAGGIYVQRGAQYSYTTGPDGQVYATGGEVSIDRAPVPDDPEATLEKLQQVQRAALAPVDPSSQDRAVAAAATVGIAEARIELARRQLIAYQNIGTTTNTAGFSIKV